MFKDYSTFVHTTTLAACIVAPVLIALPPRKLDLYTFSLAGAFVASANHQVKERTGLGFVGHASRPFVAGGPTWTRGGAAPAPLDQREMGVMSAGSETAGFVEKQLQLQQQQQRGMTIMADQKAREDWKTQRLKEEQEKLDQGEGYGSMIVDQIWEVWNQGETKAEELKNKDEQVVQAKEAKTTNSTTKNTGG